MKGRTSWGRVANLLVKCLALVIIGTFMALEERGDREDANVAQAQGSPTFLQELPVYFIYADMVRGSAGTQGSAGAQTNLFRRGEEVIWRAIVLDALSGQMLGKEAEVSGIKVTVHVEGGPSLQMRFEGQSRTSGLRYWVAAWRIPADWPIGVRRWWVTVTDPVGVSARFEPIGMATEPGTAGLVVRR